MAGASAAPDPSFRDPFDASWRERATVLGGVAGTLLLLLGLGLVFAPQSTLELMGLVPVSIFAAGKFLPLWGISEHSSFSPWELGLVIWALDTLSVLVIVYALEGFYKLDRLKRTLDRIQRNSKLVLAAYPRIRRAAIAGVVLFVLFPIAGTGAVGGTFLGILLGLHRYVLIAAVSFGGLLGGMTMAFAAVNFATGMTRLREAQQAPEVKYLIVGGVLAVVVAGLVGLNRAYRRALDKAERNPDSL